MLTITTLERKGKEGWYSCRYCRTMSAGEWKHGKWFMPDRDVPCKCEWPEWERCWTETLVERPVKCDFCDRKAERYVREGWDGGHYTCGCM
jgi:hypothetical protein